MKRAARRRRTIVSLLFALIWTQLAVAAYACPALTAMATAAASAHDCESGSPAPAIPDPDNPNLCLQHALQGDQRIDSGPGTPPAPAPAPGLLIGAATVDASPQLATLITAQSRVLRATAPPKSIAHCCFRI
jgi:hypothetical protein